MFVDIENPKSPLKVANILMAYDKGVVVNGVRMPPQKLTTEVCFDILKSTNYARNIKDMLSCIANLPNEEQAKFKEVVLATFSNREQPEAILQIGQELAEKSGYEIEFAEAQKINDGLYLYSGAEALRDMVSAKSHLTNEDFSAYDKVVFLSHDKIQFNSYVKFPKNIEIPNSSDVSFYDEKKGSGCHLRGVQSICFKDGARVNLCKAKKLPKNLDFSHCSEVNLRECKLSEQPNLHFKVGARVNLSGAKKIPNDIDLSCCDVVKLICCNLQGLSHLRFKEGATVYLMGAENFPESLDVSCCDKVDLSYCDFVNVKQLFFKNREQMEKSNAVLPDDWNGKLTFVDEQPQIQKEENIDSPHKSTNGLRKFIGKFLGKGGR